MPDDVADLEWVRSEGRHLGSGQARRDRLVARDPCDLLGHVRLDEDVAAPCRDDGRQGGHIGRDIEGPRARRDLDGCRLGRCLDAHADPRQECRLFVRGESRAEQAVHPRGTECDPRRQWFVGGRVDPTGSDGSACPLGDERRHPIRADPREAGLLALLEAKTRLRSERVSMPGPPDGHRVEDRRLDDDVRGPLVDLAGRATHHPGDGDGATLVGDDERLGVQDPGDVVERLEPFALLRAPDDEPAAADRAGVERMGGFAEFEHDHVARVDDVADRSHAGRLEPHLDRVGGRRDANAGDDAAHEPGAHRRILDLHGEPLRDGSTGLDQVRGREADGRPGGCRDLPGEADQRQRVASVRLHVHVEDRVPVQLGQAHPDRCTGRQDEDAIRVRRQVQLVARAEHPVADDAHLLRPLDASVARQHGSGQRHRHPLAGCDVRRAAYDREWLALPHPDRRERQPVRVRVSGHREQLADHDVAPVSPPALDGLDLHAQEREPFRELFRGQVEVHEVGQPAERHPHRNCSRKRRSLST